MKTIKPIATICLASLLTANTYANTDTQKNIKRAGAFSTPTIAGAMIAGPAGMMVGAFTGVFLSEHAGKKHDEEVLAEAQRSEQEAALAAAEAKRQKLRELKSPILFNTNSDQLAEKDLHRLNELAAYLNENTEKTVSLNAYADPVGSKQYNQQLSEKRAEAVEKALTGFGVEAYQIESYSHGESSEVTDTDLYTFERRVEIDLYTPTDEIASNE